MPLARDLQFTEVAQFDETEFNQDAWELTDWRDQKNTAHRTSYSKITIKDYRKRY